MKLRLAVSSAIMFVAAAAWPQSAPICVTHFYNQSDFRWSISNADGRKTTMFIAPHSTATVGWGTTTSVMVRGEDPNGTYIRQFTVQEANSSVVIQSAGPDKMLTLNQPNSGDITTCSGGC